MLETGYAKAERVVRTVKIGIPGHVAELDGTLASRRHI
jgi:hypothetical protein